MVEAPAPAAAALATQATNLMPPQESALRANDLNNLLDHMAWKHTVLPALLEERSRYEKLLVASVLGNRIVQRIDANLALPIASEQFAGRVYGIDFVINLLEKILSRGAEALKELRAEQFETQFT